MSNRYDLHAHTTASDGTFTPAQVIALAQQKGLSGVGITDHDTTDGIEEALSYGKEMGIEVIPGVEINTEYNGKELHVLGYCFDRNSSVLQDLFARLRSERIKRMERILDMLKQLGILIERQEVLREAGEGAIGRPHIARVLVKKGFINDVRAAFDQYLGMGGRAYVERFKLCPAEAVRLITDAGGVPVIAHPGLIGKDALIEELIPAGLMGIEAYHPDHSEEARSKYARLAHQLGLLATGGSDFHGSGAEHRGDLGSVTVDRSVVDQIKLKSDLF